ncbi:MAG: response regulator transcription factor [Microthrixaceae bacterium]
MSERAHLGTSGGLLVHPAPSPELARLLDLGGHRWTAVADDLEARNATGDPAGAIVELGEEASPEDGTDTAWSVIEALARREQPIFAVLILVRGTRLGELAGRDELFADFCLTPFHPTEMEARLAHLLAGPGDLLATAASSTIVGADSDEVVRHGPLVLNTESYQARIGDRALDLTYMEYELLRFLAQSPDKVHSREVLLSQVWGYDYYGGARTVDVHIRRLRSKLGEEHARMIQTVRSVGYRFGRAD